MSETRAIHGLDLHVEVSGTRPSRSLERALRAAVDDGRLAAGTRLPASRSLARDLGVARSTVEHAYAQLAAEGWLTSRVGAGTWVAERPAPPARTPALTPSPPRRIELRAGIPDASAFPRAAWARAARRAVADAPADLLGYGDPRGAAPVRDALAAYLGRARGVRADADHVVVTGGFVELLALTCHALRARGGRTVAVEAYGHELHRRVIEAAGLDVVPVAVDGGGIDVAALTATAADAVLLTPAHQFPTGVPLAPERRLQVVHWARRTGALVLEDDYDGELRYDRRAVGALQALAPDQVLYAGTASKAVGPAVGLAWGVVPAAWAQALVAERRTRGHAPSPLAELTLAELLTAHDYDRAVRRVRDEHRRRRATLERLVAERLPGCALSGVPAGLHAILHLPAGTEEDAVVAQALERGLTLEGLSAFAAPGAGRPGAVARAPGPAGRDARPAPGVVVGFGAPPPHLLREALDTLVASVRAAAPT